MLSKFSEGISYQTDLPLGAETDWVVFPLTVSVKDKSYSSALKLANEVSREAENELIVKEDLPCNLQLLDFDVTYKNFKVTIELRQQSNDEFNVLISEYVVLKFDAKGGFWQKAEIIAKVLDKLVNFARQYRSNKQVNIQILSGNTISKSIGAK
ncbi:hypothetical protein IQ249_17435 [Lusitaniella coriacea LEGE 07157]|uniref:Uncharacterized protein n=1 Tax=Lusitaniella coriacea LEGE 07157 TaxID=945747 RepID=A0A8J7DY62_9CYAN|nr:hypothetical protein [Lusitaniella coriacea]MBE9117682.1 hypothetical protein [Lusitaniella coriacea LEGE 07157]